MITHGEILESLKMIQEEHLDIRTITMGISLRDCCHPNIDESCRRVYDKIVKRASRLVDVGNEIEKEYGIPIINKRVAVTPVSLVAESCDSEDYYKYALAMEKAADQIGIDFIGGFSALVHKGYTKGDRILIESIPKALSSTTKVCSSVNVGTTETGINMDAVKQMGQIIKECARLTADSGGSACARLVVFANAPEDNPFMAGAFH